MRKILNFFCLDETFYISRFILHFEDSRNSFGTNILHRSLERSPSTGKIFFLTEEFSHKSVHPLVKKKHSMRLCKKESLFRCYILYLAELFFVWDFRNLYLFLLFGRKNLRSSPKVFFDTYGQPNLKIPPNVCEKDEKTIVAAAFLRAALRSFGGDQENRGWWGRGSRARKSGFFAGNHGGGPARVTRFARVAQNVPCEYNPQKTCIFSLFLIIKKR